MNRPIKFRAWDKKNGYYADYEDIEEEITAQATDGWRSEDGGTSFNLDYGIKDFELEQYTGLKDKNGKEIYEGDILRTTDRVTVKDLIFPIGVVEFKQQAFWICNVPSERPDFTHNETLLKYWETDLEVIGNIHENPELLGGEG